ncbi:DNA starvation/stationary phase protection protein [Paroceanicella profunda]|uniref:DNA starvation/stationary phase protection protein n=1 Tax=Paroceanicella profunda TaxID=2579971 RepID=A0A5B8FX18_9RHOB|nr:Dps family protein [Paroceanicella profunda]QDL91730.1 DNA starvation/stationary phase protection protein [Paroceanicella profunda]
MASPLKATPTATRSMDTGVTHRAKVAAGLEEVLADTYRLLFKTHTYHWNVTGPLFYSIHHLTEEQYQDLFEAADVLAERIRALGQVTPMRFADMASNSAVKDLDKRPSAGEMIDDLRKDHEQLAKRLHKLIRLAEDNDDDVTGDLAIARSSVHEKAAWMLRAMTDEA